MEVLIENETLGITGNVFSYINRKCKCNITTTYDENDSEQHSFRVKALNDGEYLYTYAPLVGLIKNSGAGIKVIEDLLNTNLDEFDRIKDFIDKYGFLIKLSEKSIEFDYFDVEIFLYRYQTLVKLMAAIKERNIDYIKIFHLICILLFGHPSKIENSNTGDSIRSCEHPFTKLWFDSDKIEEIYNYVIVDNDPPYYDYYPVEDTFTDKTEKIDYIKYNEDVGNTDNGSVNYSGKTIFRMKITYLYKNAFPADPSARRVIDFFYHLVQETNIEETGKKYGELKTKDNITDIKNFNIFFADKLILLAKQTIKEEFDYTLSSIHPVYNIETMAPEWKIPNLYTALYLALFYTRPDYEIYRKCENPYCNQYFKVRTTNSTKRYHDKMCQNAAAQMRHRKRKKNNN